MLDYLDSHKLVSAVYSDAYLRAFEVSDDELEQWCLAAVGGGVAADTTASAGTLTRDGANIAGIDDDPDDAEDRFEARDLCCEFLFPVRCGLLLRVDVVGG